MIRFPQRGYLYVVAGPRRYADELSESVASLRRADPTAHVTLITDKGSLDTFADVLGLFDHVDAPEDEDATEENWKRRLLFRVRRVVHHSPYARTFSIDSDTYFVDNCRPLFDLLDYHDLCLAHGTRDRSAVLRGGREIPGYNPYNVGVMLFRRNDRMRRLAHAWATVFEDRIKTYPHDQPALMEALLAVPCRVYVLQNNYNARTVFFEKFFGRVAVVHGRHRDLALVADRLNVTDDDRFWLPEIERCVYSGMPLPEAFATGSLLVAHGLKALLRRAGRWFQR